jgi:chromate transporter
VRSVLLTFVTLFVPLSLVSVGGGQTVVAEIHHQVVEIHHWLTETQFVDAFAIARMAPGPGTVLVTLLGWDVAGFWGAVVASLAIFVPSALLIYMLARLWARYRGARWQVAMEAGLRPVAAGMILAAGFVLLQALEGGWVARGIAVASTGLLMVTKISPIVLMALGAVVFIAVHAVTG